MRWLHERWNQIREEKKEKKKEEENTGLHDPDPTGGAPPADTTFASFPAHFRLLNHYWYLQFKHSFLSMSLQLGFTGQMECVFYAHFFGAFLHLKCRHTPNKFRGKPFKADTASTEFNHATSQTKHQLNTLLHGLPKAGNNEYAYVSIRCHPLLSSLYRDKYWSFSGSLYSFGILHGSPHLTTKAIGHGWSGREVQHLIFGFTGGWKLFPPMGQWTGFEAQNFSACDNSAATELANVGGWPVSGTLFMIMFIVVQCNLIWFAFSTVLPTHFLSRHSQSQLF